MQCNIVYKSHKLIVKTLVSPKTGYGWLASRAFVAFPTHIPMVVYVLPPRDALLVYSELTQPRESDELRVCLFAVDGTEIPESWRRAEPFFDYFIIMLDHNNFREKCPKIIGEFYPKPRTLVYLERYGDVECPPPDCKRIGTVASGHVRKNFPLIVELARSLPDVQVSVVTDERTLQRWSVGAPKNLELCTNLSDRELILWYKSLWAFFSLSMGEGGALPAVEAAVLGIPTILPDHTAFKLIPASARISSTEVPAHGDPNLAGSMFIPNVQELIEIVRTSETLPAPPLPAISFESLGFLPFLELKRKSFL